LSIMIPCLSAVPRHVLAPSSAMCASEFSKKLRHSRTDQFLKSRARLIHVSRKSRFPPFF
jgi:hypothetical protein